MLEIYISNDLVSFLESLPSQSFWYESPTLVAIISGGGAVLAAVAAQMFNYFSERRRERHKERVLNAEFRNKKQERVHDKKINALKKFVELKESMLPSVWGSPSADAYEFYESFLIWESENYFLKLDGYVRAWLYILSDDVSNKLKKVMYIFNTIDYEKIARHGPEYSPSLSELSKVEEAAKELDEALNLFKQEVGIIDKV